MSQISSSSRWALDTPSGASIEAVTRFSGWVISANPDSQWVVELSIGGVPAATTMRVNRPDVGLAYPDEPRATQGGFFGDLIIGPDPLLRPVSIEAELAFADGSRELLFSRQWTPTDSSPPQFPRERAFDVEGLLDRACRDGGPAGTSGNACVRAEIAGVLHFHPLGDLPLIRLRETGATNAYSDLAHQVISQSDGPVLDFGAGIKSIDQLHANVVLLDAVHFPFVDVVNTCPRLPFRDNAFAAVVSQAVFEHLADPWQVVKELGRVLQPGGRLLIDTAFMQPFHGSPDHYYNMTVSGLRRMMSGFEILQLGVQPHQTPARGFLMQFSHALEVLAAGKWRDLIESWRNQVQSDAAGLDQALGSAGVEMLAAGVYVLARKPA